MLRSKRETINLVREWHPPKQTIMAPAVDYACSIINGQGRWQPLECFPFMLLTYFSHCKKGMKMLSSSFIAFTLVPRLSLFQAFVSIASSRQDFIPMLVPFNACFQCGACRIRSEAALRRSVGSMAFATVFALACSVTFACGYSVNVDMTSTFKRLETTDASSGFSRRVSSSHFSSHEKRDEDRFSSHYCTGP